MPKIWEILAEEGQESILLNLPLTYPAFEMKGRMIAGMPLPADAPDICYPDSLIDEVKRECGGYIPDIDFLRGEIPDVTDSDAVDQLLGEISEALKYRLLASQYLMSKGDWRMFFSAVAISSSDKFLDIIGKSTIPTGIIMNVGIFAMVTAEV